MLTFSERTADAPQALRAWFFPGDDWGQEFVYPKTRAIAIAAEVNEPVLSAAAEPAEEQLALLEEPVEAVPPGIANIEPEVAAEREPDADEFAAAFAVEPAPEPESPYLAGVPATLPQTGTDLPLIGLLGAGSLALGGLLRLRYAR